MKKILAIMLLCSVVMAATAAESVSVADVPALLKQKKVSLVDLRQPKHYVAAHIKGARNIWSDAADFRGQISSISKKKTLLLYAENADSCAAAAALAEEMGYKVCTLDGGFPAWQSAGNDCYVFTDTLSLNLSLAEYADQKDNDGFGTLFLAERFLHISWHNTALYFQLLPDNIVYAHEQKGETVMKFVNAKDGYDYVQIELDENFLTIYVKRTGEITWDKRWIYYVQRR